MTQPIHLLTTGKNPATGLAAEILRCEGYPWLAVCPAETCSTVPPDVHLIVTAGTGLSSTTAERLANTVANGTPLVALAPDPALVHALGLTVGNSVEDAHLTVTDLTHWEHSDLPLLCPDHTARPITGGQTAAKLCTAENPTVGAGIVTLSLGKGRAWIYGYDLCQTIATLRHGTGRLDHPEPEKDAWTGPRALYSFWELAAKLPQDIPIADLHQDILRSILTEALADTSLPRLWHFPEGAPAVWTVRGDGCGEQGADIEIETVEKHGAYLTFCRPPVSRFSGETVREWHTRGHGITIEANINAITQPTINNEHTSRTAAELNAHHLPAIRENLTQHRDSFHRETGLEMETFLTHGAQWTGLPMAHIVRELGWHTLLPFQSYDPRIRPGDRTGPYLIATALPMRFFDPAEGVQDIWHFPFQWIDMAWQLVARQKSSTEPNALEPETLHHITGQTTEDYGAQLAQFAQSAASRFHVTQACSFHPCYVSQDWPYLGSSKLALEIALEAAKNAGCRFENLENFSRFFRARANVQLTAYRTETQTTTLTLESKLGIQNLTLLLPEQTEIRSQKEPLSIHHLHLEGRTQCAVILHLRPNTPETLHLRKTT
ncbi:MAG: hypothetical protein O2954_10265 [bacterium]|nr:hypothetical protein [bacterium]